MLNKPKGWNRDAGLEQMLQNFKERQRLGDVSLKDSLSWGLDKPITVGKSHIQVSGGAPKPKATLDSANNGSWVQEILAEQIQS